MEEAEQKVTEYIQHENSCVKKCSFCQALDLSSLDLNVTPDILSTEYQLNHLKELYLDYNDLTKIPGELFTNIHNLKRLSLVGNGLVSLPENIGDACNLEELYLNENIIVKLPNSFIELNKLQILNLVGNKITTFPCDIEKLHHLQTLNAAENGITVLPDTFGLLSNLEVLDLESNQLESLPRSFGCLSQLKILNLGSNSIGSLPSNFNDLISLENLDLSTNRLESLPDSMSCGNSLKKLYLESNGIVSLPSWIGDLPMLEEFSLKDNHLKDEAIPVSFGLTSKKLKILHMGGNFMTSLPETIGKLESLEKIHFGSVICELERRNFQNGNWLWKIPETFGELTNLRSVNLEENQIRSIPESFGCLVNVEFLDLGQNQLHELPESFCSMRSLRVCQLSKNHIELLPSSFGQLSSLEDLRLDHNQIAELPKSFAELTLLKSLDLFNNRLIEMPDCLKYLTNLVRLDLDRNDLHIDPLKIPQLTVRAKYAPRDPNLRDNWRGRARQDLVNIEIKQLNEEEIAKLPAVDISLEPEEEYNFNALQNAIRRNMSIWRSHTGSDTRQVDDKYGGSITRSQHPALSKKDYLHYEDDDTEQDGEDDDLDHSWSETGTSEVSEFSNPSKQGSGMCMFDNDEDWDKEVDNTLSVDPLNPYGTQRKSPMKDEFYEPGVNEYKYVGYDHIFLPSIYHVPLVRRSDKTPVTQQVTEDGQFESDEGNSPPTLCKTKKPVENETKRSKDKAIVERGQFDDCDVEPV